MRRVALALRRSPMLLAGTVMLALVALVAVLAPWIAPFDPRTVSGDSLDSPSRAHLLGTNNAGADILSRLVWGSRNTLVVALCATAMVMAIGLGMGLTAGLRGGLVDLAVMRITDVFLAIPVLPLLIFVSALLAPSVGLSILLIGLFTWPPVARIVRSQTLSLRSRGFVRSAQGFGAGPLYVMRRHLIPALGPIIVVNVVDMASTVVAIEAGLAFLGLGDPAAVSWGQDLERALTNQSILIGSLWAWWLLPIALALVFTLLGLLLVGVGLEPWLNPRTRSGQWAVAVRRRPPGRARVARVAKERT